MPEDRLLAIDPRVEARYPGFTLGLLAVRNIQGPPDEAALAAAAGRVLSELKIRYEGLPRAEVKRLYPVTPYLVYFKKFDQTYPVQHQLESVLQGRRDLASGPALPRIMFLAEMESLLLTAGHDLDRVEPPLRLAVADDREEYMGISGREAKLVIDDVYLADQRGIISSILKGPDRHTRLTADTKNVLFTVYAPPGVLAADLNRLLDRLAEYLTMAGGEATVELKRIHSAAEAKNMDPE